MISSLVQWILIQYFITTYSLETLFVPLCAQEKHDAPLYLRKQEKDNSSGCPNSEPLECAHKRSYHSSGFGSSLDPLLHVINSPQKMFFYKR